MAIVTWVARIAAALVLAALGTWSALMIAFHLPASEAVTVAAGAGIAVLGLAGASSLFIARLRPVRLVLGGVFLASLAWFFSIAPSNDRNFTPEQRYPMVSTIAGDTLTVERVRNFRWRSETDTDLAWETRTYDLSKANALDLIMIHWMGPTIGHAIVSFGFNDGQVLAISIEIRREVGEAFSPLAGFFRRFELIYLSADEQDLLGLSAAVRREDIQMFRLRMQPAAVRALLEAYVREANIVAAAPKFYNTVTVNCTTAVFTLVRALSPGLPIDWRILVNGFLPDYLADIGAIDTSMPVSTLRDKGRIAEVIRQSLGQPDFAARIRAGVPAPR